MTFAIKLALARLTRAVARILGRGGTTLPGRVLLRLEPEALSRLAAGLGGGSVVVSATNGKTTTSTMLAAALERSGRSIVHNRAGSNMHWGVATALLEADDAPGALGLFEVDEAWLEPVAAAIGPRLMVLGNLFRDQLDRYGELDAIADAWALAAASSGAALVLNADDPLVADLGRGEHGGEVIYYGLEDETQALSAPQHASDSKHCRNCGAAYRYDAVYMAHLGRYRCPTCGRSRPTPQFAATAVRLHGMTGSEIDLSTPTGAVRLELPLPGLYNVYNALAAVTAVASLGVEPAEAAGALESMTAAFGRTERVDVAGRPLSILLVKNPAGANEVLRTLALEGGDLDLWIALNDRIADGRDVSWIWDADFELLADRLASVTCTGTRADELALRLKYAGVRAQMLVEPNLERALDGALARGNGRPLYALPTYTALIELRDLLADRGLASRWSG